MADLSSVEVNSAIGVDGNSYTTAISNDKLTNDDFLKLMLEEMKMQDPTKPMDSAALMDSQLQMSTIEANMAMSESMMALQQSYATTALSTAANIIGNIIEDGSLDDKGIQKSFKVETVENRDGEIYLNTRQLTGLTDNIISVVGDTKTALDYDSEGYIYEGTDKTDIRIKMTDEGRFEFDANTQAILLDLEGNIITDTDITDKYKYNGTSVDYSSEIATIPMNNIQKVR